MRKQKKLEMPEFTNKNLESLLLKEENFKALENQLIQTCFTVSKLTCQEDDRMLDIGEKLSDEKLKEVFPAIKKEADEFLEVKDIPTPSFGYSNFFKKGGKTNYSLITVSCCAAFNVLEFGTQLLFPTQSIITAPLPVSLLGVGMGSALAFGVYRMQHNNNHYNHFDKAISLLREERTIMIPTIGHEYAHFVQDCSGWNMLKLRLMRGPYSILNEGHAQGVEKYVAMRYSEKEDNPSFVYQEHFKNFVSLARVYNWACEELDKQSHVEIGGIKIDRASVHSKGLALFLIYEAKHGPEIYADALKGKFAFK
jgi:hypothetical protein